MNRTTRRRKCVATTEQETAELERFSRWAAEQFGVSWKRWTSKSLSRGLVNQRSASMAAAMYVRDGHANMNAVGRAHGMLGGAPVRAALRRCESQSGMMRAVMVLVKLWKREQKNAGGKEDV